MKAPSSFYCLSAPLLALAFISLLAAPARAQAGRVDTSFNAATDGAVDALAFQADGKIVLGGTFMQVDGTPHRNVARINADGGIDPTFITAADSASPRSRCKRTPRVDRWAVYPRKSLPRTIQPRLPPVRFLTPVVG